MSEPSRTSGVALVETALVGGLMCALLATRLPDVARYRQQQREAEAEANLLVDVRVRVERAGE